MEGRPHGPCLSVAQRVTDRGRSSGHFRQQNTGRVEYSGQHAGISAM